MSGTESIPALVRFGNGLRGTGGRALKASVLGLVAATPGEEKRGACESGDVGSRGDGGTYTSVDDGAVEEMGGGRGGSTGGSAFTSSCSPNSRFHASMPPISSTGTRLRILRNAVSYIARTSLASGASGGPGDSEASS